MTRCLEQCGLRSINEQRRDRGRFWEERWSKMVKTEILFFCNTEVDGFIGRDGVQREETKAAAGSAAWGFRLAGQFAAGRRPPDLHRMGKEKPEGPPFPVPFPDPTSAIPNNERMEIQHGMRIPSHTRVIVDQCARRRSELNWSRRGRSSSGASGPTGLAGIKNMALAASSFFL